LAPSDTVITVEHLSKSYLVGHRSDGERHKRYTALRDVISNEVRNIARNAINIVRGRQVVVSDQVEEFWALKDASFEVKRGEVLGIIGRNGAGKTTLLKILSRITEPTEGRVLLRGRVASLLEVGTGFHPELTGRENIYLNGAILGMTRVEIRRKFDEIVAFAEVEKFLDTPVKRYSSGMYVRLAFAVAAHLDPEILVVDEVLAVGDADFQNKCIGKMNSVAAAEGRTVLFVSHNMAVVQHLCERAILLRNGGIVCDDAPPAAISQYLSDVVAGNRVELQSWTDRTTTGEARITKLEFDDGCNGTAILFGGNLRIRIHARLTTTLTDPVFGVVIHDAAGVPISDVQSINEGLYTGTMSDEVVVEVHFPNLSLYPGRYLLSPWITDSARQRAIDLPLMCATFDVYPAAGKFGDLMLQQSWGKVFIPSQWKVICPR
jgi:lipopolysaccharide transport system ATP-binding protein